MSAIFAVVGALVACCDKGRGRKESPKEVLVPEIRPRRSPFATNAGSQAAGAYHVAEMCVVAVSLMVDAHLLLTMSYGQDTADSRRGSCMLRPDRIRIVAVR